MNKAHHKANPMLGHTPQHALRTLACLTTMHVSGPKHSPHVRPQCGAPLEISGHVSTQEKKKKFLPTPTGLALLALGEISGTRTPCPLETRKSFSRAALPWHML
ncbi:hypothetical protein GGI42DRAFT_118496 [Trichoderma sp. SZMC 28013]